MITHSIFSKPHNFSLRFVYYSQLSLSLNSMKTTFVHIQLTSLLHNFFKKTYKIFALCPMSHYNQDISVQKDNLVDF